MNNTPNNYISLSIGAGLVAFFIAFRLGLLFAFNTATGGLELASDVVFHEMIISDPFAILRGEARYIASYPPFQWLIEWPLFTLFASYFSQMVSYRLLMITVEVLAFATLIAVLNTAQINRTLSIFILSLFVLAPHQIFASEFFVQEDVIGQWFVLMALLFALQNKRGLSIAVLSGGVLIAKLFLVIPLFYFVFFQGQQVLWKRIVVGVLAILPIAITYLITVSSALVNGGDVPIRDFTPDAAYAANFWVLVLNAYPDALMQIKNVSLMITLVAQIVLFFTAIVRFKRTQHNVHPAILLTVPLAVFFATFYQHMPEYLLLLWPAAALMYRSYWAQVAIAAALSFAWAPRVFHGLKNIGVQDGTAAGARIELLGPILKTVSLNAELINQLALAAHSILYLVLLASLMVTSARLLSNKHPG